MKILIAGIDYVMPKLFYFQKHWESRGFQYIVFGNDKLNIMGEYPEIKFTPSKINRIRYFFFIWHEIINLQKLIKRENIKYCELYYNAPLLHQMIVFMVLVLSRVKIISIYRGGEILYWDKHSTIKKKFMKISNKISFKILYKEKYMPEILKENGMYDPSKIFHLSNSITYLPLENIKYDDKENILLFHNSFKKWRNPDFTLEIINDLKMKFKQFKLVLAGYREDTDDSVIRILKEKIEKYDLNQYVEIYKFAENAPDSYYKKAKIFLLPSDLVFCNYSLLEAMNYGVVPIVSNADKDSNLIIDNEKDGFIVHNDATIWSDIIYKLLSDENYYLSMSEKTNLKIFDSYNSQKRFDDYFEFISKN